MKNSVIKRLCKQFDSKWQDLIIKTVNEKAKDFITYNEEDLYEASYERFLSMIEYIANEIYIKNLGIDKEIL